MSDLPHVDSFGKVQQQVKCMIQQARETTATATALVNARAAKGGTGNGLFTYDTDTLAEVIVDLFYI